MIVVFLFSYTHSHRGQNSFSFSFSLSPIRGRITPTQLHLCGGTFSMIRILSSSCESNVVIKIKSLEGLIIIIRYSMINRGGGVNFVFHLTLVLFVTDLILGHTHLQRLSSYDDCPETQLLARYRTNRMPRSTCLAFIFNSSNHTITNRCHF